MKKCPYCAKDNLDDAAFCSYCGHELAVKAAPVSDPIPVYAAIPADTAAIEMVYKEIAVKNKNRRSLLIALFIVFLVILACVAFAVTGSNSNKIKATETAAPPLTQQAYQKTHEAAQYSAQSTGDAQTLTAQPTVTVTKTPTITQTSTITLTPTKTQIPSATLRPTRTPIPSATIDPQIALRAEYGTIAPRELETYADNHKGEKVKLTLYILSFTPGSDNQELQGDISGTSIEIIVDLTEPATGIYKDDTITVYGTINGNYSYTSVAGWNMTEPQLIDAFYTMP